jgi:hypothetical protein
MLAYPNFNKEFVIHMDASHTQLGAMISQDGKPIAFFSRKLNGAQTWYMTTERELLSIIETLKEFFNLVRYEDCGSHQSQESHLHQLQYQESHALVTHS